MKQNWGKVEDYQLGRQIDKMSYPCDKETVEKIATILKANPEARRIALQFPKQYLCQALALNKELRKISAQPHPNNQPSKREFYTIFDSMKKQCCTDIIGAQHIDYHLLIHFGEACFSEAIASNHYYLFPTISHQMQEHFVQAFGGKQFVEALKGQKIRYLLTEQRLYCYVKAFLGKVLEEAGVKLLKLPFDKHQNDRYLIFGYYATPQNTQQTPSNNNILVLFAEHPQPDNKLISDLHLTLGSFSADKSLFTAAPQIYISSLQLPEIQPSNFNYAKPLMMRLSMIGELQKYDVFGLLVSNAGSNFSKTMVEKCKAILDKHHKRYFVFMMNNLNEVKLGNFPEIQVYVVISCFNNSCFSTKEFHRLLVTPMDLEVAFDEVSISEYNFDLNHPRSLTLGEGYSEEGKKNEEEKAKDKLPENEMALTVQQKQELVLVNTLQTLDYYRSKEYKGLDFSEKKPVEKIKKGKIGLAQQYKPLPKEQSQF